MIRLADYLAKKGTFIIYLSTNQVFSGQMPYVPEDAPYQPLNEYGRQKSIVENFIKEKCQPAAIVRLTKVIEPNMPLIQNWIEQLKQNQSIDAFHDMMLAPVSLRQVVDVLTELGEKRQPGCYALSGPEDVSYQNVATYLVNMLDVSPSLVRPVSALEKGIKKNFLPQFTTMLCSSTIALCGKTPPHFQEVLQECFNLKINN
jgi:dTDP-4-dehydrorhamnose reductase